MIDINVGDSIKKLTTDVRTLILAFEVESGLSVDKVAIYHDGHAAGVAVEVKGSYKVDPIKV